MLKTYRTIFNSESDELIISKSKFIGESSFTETEEEAVSFINSIKSKYKDATHYVYAYILGENSQTQRYSDDGEPGGTAGIPMLNYLKSENITNVTLVCVRYFGGIKLGTGGLSRAYAASAKRVVEKSGIVESRPFSKLIIEMEYGMLGKIEHFILGGDVFVVDKQFQEKVTMTILVEDSKYKKIQKELIDISSDTVKIIRANVDHYLYDGEKILFRKLDF
jgi:uncharacterized YigZ family protein